jgi:hypothetical protein
MIEVHPQPERALSDGPQSLTPAQFTRLMRELSALLPALSRRLAAPAPQLAREWMASCDEAIERLQTARRQFSRRIARSAAA